MARGFADAIALFCLPFIIYGVGLLLRRRYPFLAANWSRGRLALLTVAGLCLVLLGLLVFGFAVPRHQGGYAPAHIERMGSLMGIAETKGAIYEALSDDGVAVINADDAFAPYFSQIVGSRRIFRFGVENDADIRATRIRHEPDGSRFVLHTPAGTADIRLPLPGAHSVMNALAASALGLAAGASFDAVVQGLEHAAPVKGRQVAHALGDGVVLVDDSYNANPGSVLAAIATLAQSGGEAWLVLGDMAELGLSAASAHSEIGAQAKSTGIARLWTVGPLSRSASSAFGLGAQHFESQQALIAAMQAELSERRGQPLRVLVKGSRSSAMDKIVNAMLANHLKDTGHAA